MSFLKITIVKLISLRLKGVSVNIAFVDNSEIVLDTCKNIIANISNDINVHLFSCALNFLNDKTNTKYDCIFTELHFKDIESSDFLNNLMSKHFEVKDFIYAITKFNDLISLSLINESGIKDVYFKSVNSDDLNIFLTNKIMQDN